MGYHLRCGHSQLIRHGLGDGGIEEEVNVSEIIVVIIFIFIIWGNGRWGRRGRTYDGVNRRS